MAGTRSRMRDLAAGMIAMRIVAPEAGKPGMIPALAGTTLADDLGIAGADEDELYPAMEWLLARQDKIERKLAKRHLKEGGLVLFDLASSYFEGETCPLARRGDSRDRKPGTLHMNYGLLTDDSGCPVSVSAFAGNVADPHQRRGRCDDVGRSRAELQAARRRGARVPDVVSKTRLRHDEGHGSARPPDPPPPRGPCAGASPAVHAGLLCAVADDRGVGRANA